MYPLVPKLIVAKAPAQYRDKKVKEREEEHRGLQTYIFLLKHRSYAHRYTPEHRHTHVSIHRCAQRGKSMAQGRCQRGKKSQFGGEERKNGSKKKQTNIPKTGRKRRSRAQTKKHKGRKRRRKAVELLRAKKE